MDLSWMAWTPVTAGFFVVIASLLATMTVWQTLRPTAERKGFLPIRSTRGDRFFLSLLSAAYIHLAWLGLTDWHIAWALALSAVWMIVMLRFG